MKVITIILLMSMTTINAWADKQVINGRVVGVYDGDTFHILTNVPCANKTSASKCEAGMTTYRVRMAQIDAPEHAQPYSKRAKQALSNLAFNKEARIEVQATDKYGRMVVELYVNDVWVNRELVRQGAAWVYRKYLKDPELIEIERQAQDQKAGLWALPENERMPPWEWRQNNRSNRSENTVTGG